MSSNLIEELWTVEMQYIKTRAEAEKNKDPKKVKKIRIAAKNLEKAQNEACKTTDPKLKRRADQLLQRLEKLEDLVRKENGFLPVNPYKVHYPKSNSKGSKREA